MKHFKLMKGVLACLLSLALVVTCFTSVGAKAEETSGSGTATVTAPTAVSAKFEWSTNTVRANSAAVVYVLKAKTGNTIKKGAKSVTLAKATATATDFSATMADLGIKKAKKEVYLYVCDKEFEANGTNISANLVIKAPAAKKLVGTIDYTKADGTSFNVISASAVDDKKAAIKDPEIWWSTEADGTYYQVNDSTKAAAPRKYTDGDKADAPNGFDGRTLREMLAAGGGTIYIKMAGKDGVTGDAQFGSQAVKVKIAKQAKAPNIKVDAKKDTISIKNGFDFGLATKDAEGNYTVDEWYTVLPQLKNAAVKTSAASIVATTNYTPLAKKDSNAGKEVESTSGNTTTKTYSYTAYKFKALSIDTLVRKLGIDNGDDAIIAVRKSATEKKPASAASYLELSGQSDSPLVYTQDNVSGQYLVATSTDFEKKGIILGTMVPFPGSVSGEDTIATKGYDDTFEVGKTSNSGAQIVNADTNGSTYEFAIIATKDMTPTDEKAIDWSTVSWKKFDPAKTKITSKLKTKYSLLDGTKVTTQLGTESSQITAASGEGLTPFEKFKAVKTFIVIRRTGNSKSALRASSTVLLYVAKEGKNYNLYSTVDNGDVAYKYTIKFVKYIGTTTGTGNNATTTYSWKVADDVEEITTWVKPGDTKKVAIAAVAGADFFKATSTGSGSGLTITPETSESGKITIPTSGTDAGKYAITIASSESGDKTEYIAIREYANVKVVGTGVTGASGDAVAGSEKTVGSIVAGKVSTVSASGELVAGTSVTAYVGDTVEMTVIDYTVPTGYVSGSGDVTVAAGDGYTVPSTDSWNGTDKKVKVTINTASEVTVKVKNPIKKIKVTYSITVPDGFTLDPANASIAAVEVGNDGKIATAANVSAIKATKTENETTTTKVITGWSKTSGGTTNVETSEVFTADTTLYAIWGD